MSSKIGAMIDKFKKPSELKSFLTQHFTEIEKKRLIKMIKFVELVRLGYTLRDAARKLPSDPKTIYTWINKAKDAMEYCDTNDLDYIDHQDYMYIDFLYCYEDAEIEFKKHLENIVYEHSKDEWLTDDKGEKIQLLKKGDWKAAEKILKSRFPDEYGDRVNVDNKISTTSDGGPQVGALIFPMISTNEMNLSDLSDITKSSQQFLLNKVEEDSEED